ncbi:hypothetical protein HY412_01080 [Candidatus Kaiserbacteria bacterium]|nr:hypothetical protein [Candidatus Kaiserbacteria bacterium]
MIRKILVIIAFISTIFFPWQITGALAITASFFEPLIPLAIGLFADTLFYEVNVAIIPLFTLYGAIVSAIAFFVRGRINTSIIRK